MRIKGFFENGEIIAPFLCSIDGDAAGGSGGGSGPASAPSDSSSGTGSASTSQDSRSAPQSASETSPSPDTTPPTTAAPSSSSPEPFDFGSIFGEVAPAAAPVQGPAATPAATAKPETQPGIAPAATPAVAQVPAQQQTPPAQAPVTSDPAADASSAPRYDLNDPASMSQALGQMQDAAVDSVAKTLFALSPQDIEGLETNAAETIPRLLARVFVVAQTQYLQQMARMVPAMMAKQTATQEVYRKNGDAFFKAWPQLNEAQHGDIIRRVGQVWRAQNPRASLEQAIAEIGPMAMMIAKVPATPAAQSARPNGRASPSPAFVPAVSGTASANAPAQVNPFEFLGEQG